MECLGITDSSDPPRPALDPVRSGLLFVELRTTGDLRVAAELDPGGGDRDRMDRHTQTRPSGPESFGGEHGPHTDRSGGRSLWFGGTCQAVNGPRLGGSVHGPSPSVESGE